MDVAILHLSDIHLRFAQDRILDKAQHIIDVFNGIPHQIPLCVVVLTGDTAFSGQPHEYEFAKRFLGQLRASLNACHTVVRHELVIVPGNHDCNFDRELDVRRYVLGVVANAPDKTQDISVLDACTSVQQDFFAFMATIENRPPQRGQDRLRYTREFRTSNGTLIRFDCYNTAWVSRLHEKQGELSFPAQPPAPIRLEGADDVCVAVFHHPFRWLRADNARQFEMHVEANADLLRVGHEHVVGQFQKTRPNTQSNVYYEGGPLHTGSSPFLSEFSLVLLDTVERQHSSITFSWNGGRYERLASTEPCDLAFSPQRHASFKFINSFEQELLDPGAQFAHPGKRHLTIDDIYVWPDLREFKPTVERSGRVEVIRSKAFTAELVKRAKVVVYGEESVGKTSLARAWTRTLLAQGIKPVYLRGEDFTSFEPDEVMATVRARCAIQFGHTKCNEYASCAANERAILIDDFHRSRWQRGERHRLLSALDAIFGTIVIFGDHLLTLSDIAYEDGRPNPLLQFQKFELLPFGYELRHSIVEKWLRIGCETEEDQTNLARRVHHATGALNSIIGKDLVPPHPIFLLIILQQLEATSHSAADDRKASYAAYGSYGYFYELLLARSLTNAVERGLDLDTAYQYLAEIAYRMLQLGTKSFSEEELRRLHDSYCVEYRLSLDFGPILDYFLKSNVFKNDSGQYRFKYTYQYYYSAARSLRDERLATHLPTLIRTIYTDESAGIVMFLVHLSRDERIISSMLESARSLYPDMQPCDLAEDVSFLRAISQHSARLRLPESSARENRLDLLRESDRAVDNIAMLVEDSDDTRDRMGEAEAKNAIIQLNVAFKTVQVLGQIIKNFPGSTKGALKFTIVRECYALGLRALNRLLRLISDNQGPMMTDIERWLQGRGVNPTEVGGRAQGLICWLSEALAVTFILKTAESVGLPKLSKTYDEVVAADTSVAVRMIDLAVRLEHLPGFPENELTGLQRSVQNAPFSRSVLRRLVYRHFYLYESTYRLRQRVCSSMDISLPNRRVNKELTRRKV